MPTTVSGLHYDVMDLRPAWRRTAGANKPVVFHHGVGANLNIFDEWVPIIAAHHPLARFDMRGFGQSAVPAVSHSWSMSGLIGDLAEVSEAAFGAAPVHVMGESIGGTIVLAAGLRHPDRFASVAMSNAGINGTRIGHAPGWREEIAQGKLFGPTLFTSGPKLEGFQSMWAGDIEISTMEEMNKAIDSLERMRVDFIKITDH